MKLLAIGSTVVFIIADKLEEIIKEKKRIREDKWINACEKIYAHFKIDKRNLDSLEDKKFMDEDNEVLFTKNGTYMKLKDYILVMSRTKNGFIEINNEKERGR